MSQLEYYKMEQRNPLTPEETRDVYRLKSKGCVSAKYFIKEVAHRHGFSESVITGVLIDVADELAELLGRGHVVELPGIGLLSLGVRMKDEAANAESDAAADSGHASADVEHNARSLEPHHINFRKNKDFFKRVAAYFSDQDVSRIYGREGVRIQRSPYPQVKNRMYAAREFLREHAVMTISDYARINKISYIAAQRELKASWQNPDYGIKAQGRAPHRVYVLRQAEG